MIKRLSALLSALLVAVSIYFAAPAEAQASACTGDYSIGVGGLKLSVVSGTWEDSSYVYADELVSYDSLNPVQGLRNLDQAYAAHRAACPADRVKLVGHSEGAALVHVWVNEHQDATGVSAVLIADPKRPAGPGGAGLSADPLGVLIGYPLAGVNRDYGSVPVLEVCHWDDVVCNEPSGWFGYVVVGTHTNYSFDAADYPYGVSATWFF